MSTVVEESMCPDERLVELVRGALDADEAQALEEHVASCAVCARELRWLSAEQVMFTTRAEEAPPLPAGVWDQIAARTVGVAPPARVNKPAAVRRRVTWLAGASLAAAAAVVAFLTVDHGMEPSARTHAKIHALADAGVTAMIGSDAGTNVLEKTTTRANAALDSADRDLDHAIAQLQQDYQRRRARLPPSRARRYDEEFTTALSAVEQARTAAGQDVSARRQLVRARARYLRSIQTVVLREGRS